MLTLNIYQCIINLYENKQFNVKDFTLNLTKVNKMTYAINILKPYAKMTKAERGGIIRKAQDTLCGLSNGEMLDDDGFNALDAAIMLARLTITKN